MQRKKYWQLLAAVTGALVVGPSLYAQPPGGPGGFSGGFGGGGIVGLAMRDEVQQELQLVDEQSDKVSAIAEEARDQMRDEMRDVFSQLRDLSDEERRARFGEIRGKLEILNSELEGKLKKVLLPHQFERLKQIDTQVRVQQRGASALTSGDLATTLNLTDEQRERLEQRAEEVRQELQEKIRQLQAEARDKMLDLLTPEQRAKLTKLMGDTFQLQEGDSRFGGRGGFRGDGPSERGRREGDNRRESRSRSGDESI